MIWEEFKTNAPELAALGEEKFGSTDLVLIGTLRKNGWPRISPVEFVITDGHLYLGMMWQSRKAQDLLRDPRCTVHNTVSDRHGTDGEFKIYGKAVDIQDAEMRKRFESALSEKIDWNPEESGESEYHLFSIDIESASFAFIENEQWTRKTWKA